MLRNEPKPGEFYRHFKGKLYQIITVAIHSETGEKLVVYQALYADFKIYARPLELFLSETDKSKYPQAEQKYRFAKVTAFSKNCSIKEKSPAVNQVRSKKEESVLTKVEESVQNVDKQNREEMPREINPLLLEFLEASTIHEKLTALKDKKQYVDDKCIDDLAASMDVTIEEGSLEIRYQQLVSCLETIKRFEVNRR